MNTDNPPNLHAPNVVHVSQFSGKHGALHKFVDFCTDPSNSLSTSTDSLVVTLTTAFVRLSTIYQFNQPPCIRLLYLPLLSPNDDEEKDVVDERETRTCTEKFSSTS